MSKDLNERNTKREKYFHIAIFLQSKAAYVLVYQKRGTWKPEKSNSNATATATSEEVNGVDKTIEDMDTN